MNHQHIAIEDLENLIADPYETLEVEYKRWMDLGNATHQRRIARHLCALANHGGGYLVFGIDDDMTVSPNPPLSLEAYSHDVINAIGRRHLSPQPHCDVRIVTRNGAEHPVVVVPSHGETPLTIRGAGNDDSGKGARDGIVYVRAPGPCSISIHEFPELWRPLIVRCHAAMVAALDVDGDGIISEAEQTRPSEPAGEG